MNIMKEIKKYSRIKAMSIPCILAMIVGIFWFVGVCCASIFTEIDYCWAVVAGLLEAGSYILILLILTIAEKHEKLVLVNYGLKDFLKEFIALNEEDLAKDTFYYDALEIMRHMTYSIMVNKDADQKIKDVNNCLRKILVNQASVTHMNRFVYDHRKDFVCLCTDIYNEIDKWDTTLSGSHIICKYEELKENPNVDTFRFNNKFLITQIRKIFQNISNKNFIIRIILLVVFIADFIMKIMLEERDVVLLIPDIVAIIAMALDLIGKKYPEYKEID